MANTWNTEMVRILRYLINDLDASDYTYTADRLEETLVVAAQLLIDDIDFDQTYTVEVDDISLTPDPTLSGSKDDSFINLTCLKAACIILGGEVKTAAAQSYAIVDGPSRIDVKGVFSAKKALYDDMRKTLDRAILQYKAGQSIAGNAILGPYTQLHSRESIF